MIRPCLTCGQEFESSSHGRPLETCSRECHRRRKVKQREESRQRAVARGCPDDAHGTCSGYTHYRCHCPPCRLWARTYKKDWRKAQKAATTAPLEGAE